MSPATLLIHTIDEMRRRRQIKALLASGWERVRIQRNGRSRWHWRLKRQPGAAAPMPQPGEILFCSGEVDFLRPGDPDRRFWPVLAGHSAAAEIDFSPAEAHQLQKWITEHPAQIVWHPPRPAGPTLLDWAVEQWNQQVKHRPLVNVHRRTLDGAWRQVIRFAGGDPAALVGPSHDELLAKTDPDGAATP